MGPRRARWPRAVALAASLAVVGAACIGSSHVAGRLAGSPTPFFGPSPSPGAGSGSTLPPAATRIVPCPPSPSPSASPAPAGRLPASLQRVADQVQAERGLRFLRPVSAEAVSRARMSQLVSEQSDQGTTPAELAAEGRAWITIGALPRGTDLAKAIRDFSSSQVIGFYDNETKHLVFIGLSSPTPFQRFTLAHELTHALQDQHFGLGRLDRLNAACRDEQASAFLALVEGDAVETQVRWARDVLSGTEIATLQREAGSFGGPPASTPQFVQEEFNFPYANGQAFVEALLERGGEAAVDAALRNPPVSTEQILHPDRYPGDVPQAVGIPDLTNALGRGWKAIDQEEVGEGNLDDLLQLRLTQDQARAAGDGWDGGEFVAWARGPAATAVVMRTVWDSERDAAEFVDAMTQWIDGQAAEVLRQGTSVRVLFASDPATLSILHRAAG